MRQTWGQVELMDNEDERRKIAYAVGGELDEPISRVRIETNRADGSGAVGIIYAECPVETLEVEELSEEKWMSTVRISEDGGQSWIDGP